MKKNIIISENREWISKIIIPVCGVIVSLMSILIAYSQLIVAKKEATMAELVQPIIYTISYLDAATEYMILENGNTMTLAALEPTVTIENGALKSLTALGYDGEQLYLVDSIAILPSWKAASVTIKAQISDNPFIVGRVFYDYLFLYIEPVEGEPMLDLVCAEIDLDSGAIIRTYRLQKHNLLELELNPDLDYAKKHMLEAYKELYVAYKAVVETVSVDASSTR